MIRKPLEGLKVVELGTHVAVPIAARMMGDWGAEVIKVEPPRGEAYRTIGRVWRLPDDPDFNVVFNAENTNKKSLCLDLKSQEGKDALLKLLETADVFVTNTRAKPLEKLGFGYETLKERFPKLIYAHFSGFGEKGPDKDRPGFDLAAFWARSGALTEWSLAESTPSKPTPGFGDGAVGAALLSGILAALYKREKTGVGDKLSISLYGTALWYNSSGILQGQFAPPFPRSRYVNQPSAFSVMYRTKDGDWITIAEPDWEGKHPAVMKLLGVEQYIGDERFSTTAAVRQNLKEMINIFDEAFARTETKVILEGLTALDMVHEKLANPADLCKDPQAWENGYLYEQTLESGKKVILPNNPIQFESMGQADFNLAPQLGQHSVEILKSIGYTQEQINAMIHSGAIIQK